MAPLMSRQIFVWTLPTLFLLSFLWYKRKKSVLQSDPSGTDRSTQFTDESTGINTRTDLVQDKLIPAVVEETIQVDCVSTVESNIAVPTEDSVCDSDLSIADQSKTEIDILEKSSDNVISEVTVDSVGLIEEEIINIPFESRPISGDIGEPNIESESDNISEESEDTTASQTEQYSTLSKSQLNPLAKDFVLKNHNNQLQQDELVENLVAEENISESSIEVFEEPATKVDCKSNQSWAAECELELGEAQEISTEVMARELSSEVPLEGNEEDCTARKRHDDVLSLESKLSTLELDDSDGKMAITNKVLLAKETTGIERDSANHSPAEVMLGSPSMSNCSDEHSEGSSDSGKGCSDVVTPPSRTPASGSSVSGDLPTSSVYEFVLPQLLVGRLIGRHGMFVHQIKTKTHANILIKRHPDTAKLKICAVEGTQMDIENALEMIRQKFPIKRYPNVTLDQVSFLAPVTTCPLMPESFQLQLIEGVNNDVILSSLVSPAHFFLQQPTHPTYPSLNRLNMCMNYCYNEPLAPALPMPVEASVICVAPTMGGWYRAQVISSDPTTETSDVKFIDYGGFQTVENSSLRQIRSDFINLPFQAAECYLANVKPKDGVWPAEAVAFVEQLTHGQVIQAQIYGYAEDGIPVVYLFSFQGSQVVVVNRELVTRGYAEWDEPTEEEVVEDTTTAIEA